MRECRVLYVHTSIDLFGHRKGLSADFTEGGRHPELSGGRASSPAVADRKGYDAVHSGCVVLPDTSYFWCSLYSSHILRSVKIAWLQCSNVSVVAVSITTIPRCLSALVCTLTSASAHGLHPLATPMTLLSRLGVGICLTGATVDSDRPLHWSRLWSCLPAQTSAGSQHPEDNGTSHTWYNTSS